MPNQPDDGGPVVNEAVGGALPDLCSNTHDSCLQSECSGDTTEQPLGAIPKKIMQPVDLCSGTDEIPQCTVESGKESFESVNSGLDIEPEPEAEDCGAGQDYLVHCCQHINLVACGTGDFERFPVLKRPVSSDIFQEDTVFVIAEEDFGRHWIRENVLRSSHPLFEMLAPVASIPNQLLVPVPVNSHGMSLGCVPGSSYGFDTTRSRSTLYDDMPQISEEEQIKIAKRLGLIHHLPCGIFDGMTKTRECVICMIDFSDGDKVRYLPCMHTYHTDCIDDWLMRSFTCPSCLEPVDSALLNTYETS